MPIKIAGTDLLLKLLDAATERHQVLAGNIANQNTPGYKRQVLKFEEFVQKEISRGEQDLASVEAEIGLDTVTPGRADGNNVNLEKEHASLRENMLRYELYSAIMKGRGDMLRSAIHGDR